MEFGGQGGKNRALTSDCGLPLAELAPNLMGMNQLKCPVFTGFERRLAALICVFGAAALVFSAPAQPQKTAELKPPATLAELRQRLTDHLAQPRFAAALWGVKIVALESGATVFEHNAGKLFTPASNSKLYTVALALDRLGGDYRIRTSLYAAARPDSSGTLAGDLVVYGRGDPGFNERLNGGDIYRALDPLVNALTNAGVKRITGDVVADESYFRGPPFGAGWMWDDMEYYYGAEISALTINDNTLRLRVQPGPAVGAPCRLSLQPATAWLTFSNRAVTVAKGAARSIHLYHPLCENLIYVSGQMPVDGTNYTDEVTVHNPAGLFAGFFREALIRRGIAVAGRARSVNWLDREARPVDYGRLVELGAVASRPMRELAREVQKPSQNLYTDLLLAHVGEQSRTANTAARATSEDLGIRELNRFLGQAGIPAGQTLFEEGSGLSRDNLTTPGATVTLLQFMHRHPESQAYLDALPIAGVDGTLRNRMKGTPAAGNVRAKTGSLRWTSSISGHVTTAAGERLLFSIMVNRYAGATSVRADQDVILAMLAGFTGRATE